MSVRSAEGLTLGRHPPNCAPEGRRPGPARSPPRRHTVGPFKRPGGRFGQRARRPSALLIKKAVQVRGRWRSRAARCGRDVKCRGRAGASRRRCQAATGWRSARRRR
jgi:hypothetical protein